MPGPSRSSPFYRRLLLAGGSARRDGFYDYRDTRYSAGTAMRRRFERTRPPHTAWPVALANSHSCQLPFFAALWHGQLIANRATVSASTETHGTAPERPCDGASSAPAHHTRLGLWLLPTLTPANELPFFAALCHGVHFRAGLCTCCLQKSRCRVPAGNGFANSLFISVSVLKRTFFTFYACSEEPEMDLVSHPDPKRNHFQEA